jgi:predicted RNase H-like HicB family nuclease
MSRVTKGLKASVRNPKRVHFDDACKAAGLLGFVKQGGRGSRRAFARPGEPALLNFRKSRRVHSASPGPTTRRDDSQVRRCCRMNRYPLEIFWSNEDDGFIAEVPDLPGCSARGATEADAARGAQDAIAAWIEAAQAAGREVPVPREVLPLESYSGKFLVRVPRSLHARLARHAAAEGVSLNQYVAGVLARG